MALPGDIDSPWAQPIADGEARTKFLHEVYQHVGFAIGGFILVEVGLFKLHFEHILMPLLSGRGAWMIVLLAFMGVSWLAQKWAASEASIGTQYLGLTTYVVAEAIAFFPLLFMAARYSDPDVIPTAGLITGITFAGLTAGVLMSKKDFSALGGYLRVAGFAALGLIVCSWGFGFSLGIVFAAVMAVFAGASIVYQTSNVLHHYRVGQHVAASLALFASVTLLFWYVLRIVMGSRKS